MEKFFGPSGYISEGIDKEVIEKQKELLKDFVISRRMIDGVPEELLEQCFGDDGSGQISLEKLGYLLSLPFHLKKMREDGITDLVLTPSASIPYGFVFKGLDEKMYPEAERLRFIICSPKLQGRHAQEQGQRILRHFKDRATFSIGVFDEVLSSRPGARIRRQASRAQKIVEDLLKVEVRARYGTDTVFPVIKKSNGKVILSHTGHGDEDKSLTTLNVFAKIRAYDDSIINEKTGEILTAEQMKNISERELEQAYVRTEHGKEGLDTINALYNLSDIAYKNYLSNPSSGWNPFNEDYSYGDSL